MDYEQLQNALERHGRIQIWEAGYNWHAALWGYETKQQVVSMSSSSPREALYLVHRKLKYRLWVLCGRPKKNEQAN